ncbi:MAG: glycosyltransferase family 4 protein [Rhizobacter sp.]|nr:glycosyltransferase family 4 protein [Chlorobiales bacterium]
MKVLYDISLLGNAHATNVRAGIVRTTEQIALGLDASEECELIFCCPESVTVLGRCEAYLAAYPQFGKIPLAHTEAVRRIASECWSLEGAAQDSSPAFRRVPAKIRRNFLRWQAKKMGAKTSPVDPKMVASADIFHSPFDAIPSQFLEANHLCNFLTVYDLIAISHPEYFKGIKTDLSIGLKLAFASIEQRGWALCISEATKHDLCNHLKGLDPNRAVVTPLAASDMFYPCNDAAKITAIRKKYHIPDGPYLLSLSTLEPRKNIEHVIRCFARLVGEQGIKDLSLVLAGANGWSYSKIYQEIAETKGLEGRVITAGYISEEDMSGVYSGAMMFAYMSLYEGFGLPPLEAMQCGVPVITSNSSSLPEVVGKAGVMLDGKDEDGLCEAMLSIYRSESVREAMREKSLERASEFSWEKTAALTIDAYSHAIANSK